MCEEFLSYFITKAANLSLQPIPFGSVINDPSIHSTWREFEPISLATLLKIIDQLKPTASPYDIIPSCFLKQIANTIGPSFLHVIYKCLESGIVPDYMKYATVRPLLKKPNLDPSVYSNFRPISNLPFIAKILEKIVFNQLQDFLSVNSILDTFQSGFRVSHSTETALLKVCNDVLFSTDSGNSALLVLLELTAVFDTVNHSILISHLLHYVGLRGNVANHTSSIAGVTKFGPGGPVSLQSLAPTLIKHTWSS